MPDTAPKFLTGRRPLLAVAALLLAIALMASSNAIRADSGYPDFDSATATATANSVTLNWSHVEGTGLGFQVSRVPNFPNGLPKAVGSVVSWTGTGVSWTDTSVKPGVTYRYRVTAQGRDVQGRDNSHLAVSEVGPVTVPGTTDASGDYEIWGPFSVGYPENGENPVGSYALYDAAGLPANDHTFRLGRCRYGFPMQTDQFAMTADGQLSFNSPPDYETPTGWRGGNLYYVCIEAVDADNNLAARRSIHVYVQDVEVETTVSDFTLDPPPTSHSRHEEPQGDVEPQQTLTIINGTGTTGAPAGSKPTNVTLDGFEVPVSLTWTAPIGNYSEQWVWRRIIGGSGWIKTEVPVDATSWTDPNPVESDTDYRYRVRYKRASGGWAMSPKLDIRVSDP